MQLCMCRQCGQRIWHLVPPWNYGNKTIDGGRQRADSGKELDRAIQGLRPPPSKRKVGNRASNHWTKVADKCTLTPWLSSHQRPDRIWGDSHEAAGGRATSAGCVGHHQGP